MIIREQYTPQPMTVNSTYVTSNQSIGGFICTIAGNMTITESDGNVCLLNMPMIAGGYYPLPMFLGNGPSTIVLSLGAAGTLLI